MASSPVRCCCLPRVRPIWHRTIRMSRIWNCPFFRRPRRTGWGRTAMEEICFQGFSGARVSIFSALLVVAASALIGTLAGIFSGWLEGKTDTVLMQISDIFLAFPGMVFAIAFSGVLQSGMTGAVVSLILVSWPKYARLARNRVLALKHMPFIAAARLTGNGTWKMIGRHILPNLAGQTIVTAVLDIGTMMLEIAGLSFLGLGAEAPSAEWGAMMSNGRSMLQTAPWVILAPGLAIFLTVLVCNLLGEAVRKTVDQG